MRRSRTLLVCGAFALVAVVNAAGVGINAPVRLQQISSRIDGGRVAVLIEASGPVAYVTSRPDPFTVLVDLRDVTATDVVNRLAASGPDPVAGVAVEGATGHDGEALVRVRMSLVAPVAHHVRSSRGTIEVVFDETAPLDGSETGSPDVDEPPATPVSSPGTPAEAVSPLFTATLIRSIRATAGPDAVRVVFTGNGALTPGQVVEAADPPPRLVLDFPGIGANVPAMTTINLGPVRRIRVAPHSQEPLITRVVFDLVRPTAYRVEHTAERARDLTVIFPVAAADEVASLDPMSALRAAPGATAEPADPPSSAAPVAVVAFEPVVELEPILDPVSEPEVVEAPPVAAGEPVIGLPMEAMAVTPVRLVDLPLTATAVPMPERTSPLIPPTQPSVEPVITQQPAAPLQTVGPSQAERFTGDPVTFDFQNADLRAVLRTFAEISSLNIVIDPTVQGTVDVSLRDVPWDQAFDIILTSNQLGYLLQGRVVRIAPLTVLADEQSQIRNLAEEQELSGDLLTLPRTLSYALATDLGDLLVRSVLSTRGDVQIDERTNTLIITDLQEKLDTAAELIDTLDQPEPQVEIEARIVQTSSDFAREIGVQWGVAGRVAPELANTTPLSFPNRGNITGRAGPIQGPGAGTAAPDPRASGTEVVGTAVNLPVQGPTGAIGLTLGAVNGSFNLDIALSALEQTGQGRILSMPRITTQNNVTAEVKQGIQIPIQTVSNNTVTVTFQDAALSLQVTPRITVADTIIMTIILDNSAADFSRQINGIPPIDTQYASTTVQVDDGATTVIGGIFTTTELTADGRVPYLHRIPLLGWLFRRTSVRNDNRELLIFITPRIIR